MGPTPNIFFITTSRSPSKRVRFTSRCSGSKRQEINSLMTESTVKPILALTMGDPVGIGPEIIVKSLVDARIYQVCRPLVLGDLSALERARLALEPALKIRVADCPAAGRY